LLLNRSAWLPSPAAAAQLRLATTGITCITELGLLPVACVCCCNAADGINKINMDPCLTDKLAHYSYANILKGRYVEASEPQQQQQQQSKGSSSQAALNPCCWAG
jgi:hypothetical protein